MHLSEMVCGCPSTGHRLPISKNVPNEAVIKILESLDGQSCPVI